MSENARFYAFARIAFGLLALGVTSRYIAKLITWENTGAGMETHAALALWTVLAVAVVLGWHARLAAAFMAALGFCMLTIWGHFYSDSHAYLSVLTMAIVAFSDCERHLALRPRAGDLDAWPRQLMKIQLSIVYLFAGLQKVNSEFLSGAVLNENFGKTYGPLAPLAPLIEDTVIVQPMAYAVVIIELSLATLVWSGRLRPTVLGLVLPLHVGMLLVGHNFVHWYGIVLFAFLMLTLFMAFIDVSERRQLVVWDESCSFCRRWVAAWRRLDVFHALRFVGSGSDEAYAGTGITREAAERALQVRGADGRVRSGFAAVQAIVEVLPFGFLIAPYFQFPGVRKLGDLVYERVALNRTCRYDPRTSQSISEAG